MALPVFAIPPATSDFSAVIGNSLISSDMGIGPIRSRFGTINNAHTVRVQWNWNLMVFDYLMAFYRTATQWGALPFTIALSIMDSTVKNYTAYFVPESIRLSNLEGDSVLIVAEIICVDE